MLLRDGQIIACRIHIVEDRFANQGNYIFDRPKHLSENGERYVHELANLIHPFSGEKFLAMLAAYLDESGGTDTAVLAVAGLISTASQWEKFTREWRTVLESEGVRTFHASE